MKKYLSLFIIALMALPMIAQVPATRTCGHTDHQHNLMQDADYANAYHQRMQRFQQKEQEVALNGRAQCPNPVVLPMAVHFEGINNPDIACLTALAEQQVQILIDDYAGTNADVTNWTNNAASSFPGVANGEACITFCLATSGHPTGFGLVEGQPAVTFNQFTGDFASGFAGYINIFVRSINGGVFGYSPLGGSGNGDGVVINTFAFSSGSGCASVVPQAPYNRGRTLTHELGHYLNLNHIWGDGGCGVDDGVTDTPLQGQSYGGCPSIGSATCGSTDMHMNYMDYVNDACMYMFSDGQAARMENYVAANLQNVANNAAATCGSVAPTAGISGPGSGCAPFSATFTDNSGGIPTSWAWSFPGGSPASSNAQNPPAVSYATSGTYNITLTATNAQGSDTETVQITINDCTGFDCNPIDNLNGGTLNLYAVPTAQGGGYVSGNNGYGDKAKAEYFSGIPASSEMDGVQFAFGVAVGSGNVEFTVWSDNAGSPGTELYTDMVAMSTIIADVTAGNTTLVDFGGQVAIPSSFFVGVKLPTGADTLAVITNSIDDTTPATAWEQWSDDTWYSYDDANSWGINVAHAILPNVCVPSVGGGGAPNANFSVSTISQGCETIQVQYTDNSTNTPTGWSWSFPGGTPASSTAQNPVVAYTSSGSFDATLQASNADGSNSSTQNGVVSVPVALVPNATVNPTTVDIASTATASFMDNSPGATSWMWNFGDGSATSTMQNPTHTYTVTGTYTVTLTVSDGFCTETVTTTVTVVNSLPVEDIEGLSSISLYPNPVSTALNIELVSDVSLDLVIDIYDATGRLVISAGNIAVMGETIHQVDASSLANGTYFVRITNGQNTAVTKFLKF